MTVVWRVLPHVGIDSITLGMSRGDIVAQRGDPDKGSTNSVLYYSSDSRVALNLDVGGVLEYIEASWDHVTRPRAVLGEVDLFGAPADDVVRQLARRSASRVAEGGQSVVFGELDLVLWRPTLPSDYDDDDPEDEYRRGAFWMTFGVGRPGYLRDRG